MDNPIEEYFTQKETQAGTELFRIDDKNVDIKTEVSAEELRLVTVLIADDLFLLKQGLSPVFKNYTQQFLRLMISLERKGRGEYVKINQKDNSDDLINKVGNLDNMLRSRK